MKIVKLASALLVAILIIFLIGPKAPKLEISNSPIKLNIKMIADSLIVCKKYHPNVLDYTSNRKKNGMIEFLNLLLITCNDTLQYVMQMKPFHSNHPRCIKINIVKNMVIYYYLNMLYMHYAFIFKEVDIQNHFHLNALMKHYMMNEMK